MASPYDVSLMAMRLELLLSNKGGYAEEFWKAGWLDA
jgi:hypothetical protein